MEKPCIHCTTNIQQSIDKDEVTCYRTCKEFKEWVKEQDAVADNNKHPA